MTFVILAQKFNVFKLGGEMFELDTLDWIICGLMALVALLVSIYALLHSRDEKRKDQPET